ncbi:MAG: hypothetical protein ACI8XM_001119 [Haloarculaceae archaeon]|jgi:hypothetical protein
MALRLPRYARQIRPYVQYVRPLAICFGLGVFFVGSIVLGSALAATQPSRLQSYLGPLLLLLGVSLIGGGFVMEPTEYWLDPEVSFDGPHLYFVAGSSGLFLVLAGLVTFFG